MGNEDRKKQVGMVFTNNVPYPSYEVLPLWKMWMPKQRPEESNQPCQWKYEAKPEESPIGCVCK